MSENTALAILVSGFFVLVIAYFVVLPMFNAYLQYKKDMTEMAMYDKSPIREELFKVVENEERLQRNNDDPDIKQRSGKSGDGTSVHDEELSL